MIVNGHFEPLLTSVGIIIGLLYTLCVCTNICVCITILLLYYCYLQGSPLTAKKKDSKTLFDDDDDESGLFSTKPKRHPSG